MAEEVALVTGASSGIGAEFARQLGAAGFDLVLVARRADKLEELRGHVERACGVRCHVIVSDLSRPEAPREVFATTEALGVQVDWLVNNAGFGTSGRFAQLPLDREMEQLNLNVTTPVALTHLYLPGMLARRRGRIVNIASVGAFVPTPYMTMYSGTKAFILSFTEALAGELTGTGVAAIVLCPGATKTDFQRIAGVAERLPGFAFMGADAVVQQGIAAARRGRRMFVPGWMNKATVLSTRLTPRSVLSWMAASMFAPRA